MTLDEWNSMSAEAATEAIGRCCAARAWIDSMVRGRPDVDVNSLAQRAEESFATLTIDDWLEAFAGHPRIGDLASLKAKYQNTANWTAGEQAAAAGADEETLVRLAAANDTYFERFGFIFIICATGKSASEMLAALEARLHNELAQEVAIAAAEQRKITQIRLTKLLAGGQV